MRQAGRSKIRVDNHLPQFIQAASQTPILFPVFRPTSQDQLGPAAWLNLPAKLAGLYTRTSASETFSHRDAELLPR
jgi:hypothetical protein